MNILIRYAQPNVYDHAGYNSYCKVMLTEDTFDLYRQTSNKEDEPKWEHVGLFTVHDDIPFLYTAQ